MILQGTYQGKPIHFDLSKGEDLSIPVKRGADSVEAFYIPHAEMQAFRAGSFVGSVQEGGACNCENILFNAHGNGTHTECVGHVSKAHHFLPDSLDRHFFIARLVSIEARTNQAGDRLIEAEQIPDDLPEAIIIRSLPNFDGKKSLKYSGTNPTFLHPETATLLREKGVKHLLVDLPSVDKEEDSGALAAHKNYWNYPASPRMDATITELIYVPDTIPDGIYLLNLMTASMQSDAVPSKPMIYPVLTR